MTIGVAKTPSSISPTDRGQPMSHFLHQARRGAALALAVCLAVVLSSCVSDNSASGSGENHTFTYTAVGAPGSLDIWTTYEGETSRVNAFEWGSTLVEYDDTADGCEQLAPSDTLRGNLAESWEYSPDGKQLLITLRPDVQSAAGNTLSAEDVVWSLDRAAKQSTIVAFLLHSVAQFAEKPFHAKDDLTVAIDLVRPTAMDMAIFTWPQLAILDTTEVRKHATDADPLAKEWLATNVANFGPWQLDSFDPGNEVVYVPNPNFWNTEDRGNIDKLIYRSVPDAATRLQLLESGAVDYAEKLDFDQYQQVDGSDTTTLYNCASPNRDTLQLNEAFEPFADPKVRQAISEAIDRDALVQGVYNGLASPAETGISGVYWKPGDDAERFTYDPEHARQLLAESGHSDLSFELMASPSRPGAHAQSLAVQIQSMLKKVGVTVKIRMVPGATEFSDDFFASKFDAVIYTEPPAVGDPFYSANLYNTSESFQNTFGYHNAKYDRLAKQIQLTDPGPKRDAFVNEISDLMVETVPQVYLTDSRYLHAFSDKISGFQNNPGGSLLIYRMDKG